MTGSTLQLSMLLAIAAEEAMEVAKLRELEELNRLGRLNDGTNLTQLLGRACGWAGDEGEEGGAEEEEEEEEGDASVSGCRLRSTGLVFFAGRYVSVSSAMLGSTTNTCSYDSLRFLRYSHRENWTSRAPASGSHCSVLRRRVSTCRWT